MSPSPPLIFLSSLSPLLGPPSFSDHTLPSDPTPPSSSDHALSSVLFWITDAGISAKPLNGLEPTRQCYSQSDLRAVALDPLNKRLFVTYFDEESVFIGTLGYTTFTCDSS